MVDTLLHSQEVKMQVNASPITSCEILHIDHFGPLEETGEGFKHILVVIDAFTRFIWLFLMKSTGTKKNHKTFRVCF